MSVVAFELNAAIYTITVIGSFTNCYFCFLMNSDECVIALFQCLTSCLNASSLEDLRVSGTLVALALALQSEYASAFSTSLSML